MWYGGLFMILYGVLGMLIGLRAIIAGFNLRTGASDTLRELLGTSGMSFAQGEAAFWVIGAVLIVFFAMVVLCGVLGLLSWNHIIKKRSLFWFAVILGACVVTLAMAGVISYTFMTIGLIVCGYYAAGVYIRFSRDLKYLAQNRQS